MDASLLRELVDVTLEIPGSLLLDPTVIDDPYPFYRRLRDEAPVWEVPGTGLFTVSTFDLVAEATSRVEDFSSNLRSVFYRDDEGLPCRITFGDGTGHVLATADPPAHALHRSTVFPELVGRRMDALEPDVFEIADACVTPALAEGTIEFMTGIGNVVPITMISRLIDSTTATWANCCGQHSTPPGCWGRRCPSMNSWSS